MTKAEIQAEINRLQAQKKTYQTKLKKLEENQRDYNKAYEEIRNKKQTVENNLGNMLKEVKQEMSIFPTNFKFAKTFEKGASEIIKGREANKVLNSLDTALGNLKSENSKSDKEYGQLKEKLDYINERIAQLMQQLNTTEV